MSGVVWVLGHSSLSLFFFSLLSFFYTVTLKLQLCQRNRVANRKARPGGQFVTLSKLRSFWSEKDKEKKRDPGFSMSDTKKEPGKKSKNKRRKKKYINALPPPSLLILTFCTLSHVFQLRRSKIARKCYFPQVDKNERENKKKFYSFVLFLKKDLETTMLLLVLKKCYFSQKRKVRVKTKNLLAKKIILLCVLIYILPYINKSPIVFLPQIPFCWSVFIWFPFAGWQKQLAAHMSWARLVRAETGKFSLMLPSGVTRHQGPVAVSSSLAAPGICLRTKGMWLRACCLFGGCAGFLASLFPSF